MQTRVSTKGQIVLPTQLRRRLNIHPGDPLDIAVEDGRIVLTSPAKPRQTARIVADPITGLPMLTVAPDAPILTSKDVEEMLSNFP
jgi:AbrB family looped-hinge helix DNA binding protein